MFVPVACAQCGKPFQVPEAALGGPAVCPWCRATVPALPVGLPAEPAPPPAELVDAAGPEEVPRRRDGHPALPPAEFVDAPEPLPLDDTPTAPSVRRFPWWVAGAGLLGLVLAAAATVGVLRRGEGHLVGSEWRAFAAPDGSWSADLLGRPEEETGPGGKWYVSEGWYSGVTAWVGWRDMDQVQRQLARTKDAWVGFEKVFKGEAERLRAKHGGVLVKSATKFDAPLLTHELRLATPGGAAVERVLLQPDGPNPRVYFVGMAGRFDPDGPAARRLFDSFRVAE